MANGEFLMGADEFGSVMAWAQQLELFNSPDMEAMLAAASEVVDVSFRVDGVVLCPLPRALAGLLERVIENAGTLQGIQLLRELNGFIEEEQRRLGFNGEGE